MKKFLQNIRTFFARKGYQESRSADEVFASLEHDTHVLESASLESVAVGKLPIDVIAALKQAKQEVQLFEETLKAIKQNSAV